MSEWKIFHGDRRPPHAGLERIKDDFPPWRKLDVGSAHRGVTHLPSERAVTMVNAALYLRRPLLVLGTPGCGKSSLADAVARELNMGPVLKWPINSRSKLEDGLYFYDAIDRLRDANRLRGQTEGDGEGNLKKTGQAAKQAIPSDDIGRYIQLNALGTAFMDKKPRVVLIDEIDKADVDLPNDLLHVLEDGCFEIRELARIKQEQPKVRVATAGLFGQADPVAIEAGKVHCHNFPLILFTSNGERELPHAFYRRCLRLEIPDAEAKELKEIVKAHFAEAEWWDDGGKVADRDKTLEDLVQQFITQRKQGGKMAYDQLLNTMYVLLHGARPSDEQRQDLLKVLMRELNK